MGTISIVWLVVRSKNCAWTQLLVIHLKRITIWLHALQKGRYRSHQQSLTVQNQNNFSCAFLHKLSFQNRPLCKKIKHPPFKVLRCTYSNVVLLSYTHSYHKIVLHIFHSKLIMLSLLESEVSRIYTFKRFHIMGVWKSKNITVSTEICLEYSNIEIIGYLVKKNNLSCLIARDPNLEYISKVGKNPRKIVCKKIWNLTVCNTDSLPGHDLTLEFLKFASYVAAFMFILWRELLPQ